MTAVVVWVHGNRKVALELRDFEQKIEEGEGPAGVAAY